MNPFNYTKPERIAYLKNQKQKLKERIQSLYSLLVDTQLQIDRLENES
jgi:hypothetical protein